MSKGRMHWTRSEEVRVVGWADGDDAGAVEHCGCAPLAPGKGQC